MNGLKAEFETLKSNLKAYELENDQDSDKIDRFLSITAHVNEIYKIKLNTSLLVKRKKKFKVYVATMQRQKDKCNRRFISRNDFTIT